MPEFSIGSYIFGGLLIISPLLLIWKGRQRPVIFFLLNLFTFIISCKSSITLAIAVIWVLLPYFLAPFLNKKGAKPLFFTLLGLIYIYLMNYAWVPFIRLLPWNPLFKFIGLSYFLFREIDFVLQYEGLREAGVRISLIDYLNYMLSFYTLLAGPIIRYEAFVEDFYREDRAYFSGNELLSKLQRILWGYLKVYVFSALFNNGGDYWFERISETDAVWKAVLYFLLFSFFNSAFIYFNFSGYCDVVIGGADLAGLSVKENFNKPYLAHSLTEFWNRHHISLSEWIRDYIYSPVFKALLSGPCRKKAFLGQCVALFATFLIAGIWHGTTVNYVIYGFLQGLGMVFSTVRKKRLIKKFGKKGYREYEKRKLVGIMENVAVWTFISLSFAFVGYDLVGALGFLVIRGV
ncbi:MAG: hypothetical protein J6O55_07935 [Lachnospiraceae bacterium]|nr:hypothetical protein [Lachnospiraceae bacterium]